MLSKFVIESLGQSEDYLIFGALNDAGEILDEEIARRLFSLPGSVEQSSVFPEFINDIESQLQAITQVRQNNITRMISDRNAKFFEAEADKLDGWADDLKLSLERELKDLDRQIKEARRPARNRNGIALVWEEFTCHSTAVPEAAIMWFGGCVAAISTIGSVGQRLRLSVRLDCKQTSLLRKLSSEVACSPSELVRRSLDQYAASRSAAPAAPRRVDLNVATASPRQLPIASREIPKAASGASPELCLTTIVKAATRVQFTQAPAAAACPPNVAELENQYRAFGAQIWKERNALFQRAVVAAKVAQSNNENPRDAELYAELLRLGRRFGLLN